MIKMSAGKNAHFVKLFCLRLKNLAKRESSLNQMQLAFNTVSSKQEIEQCMYFFAQKLLIFVSKCLAKMFPCCNLALWCNIAARNKFCKVFAFGIWRTLSIITDNSPLLSKKKLLVELLFPPQYKNTIYSNMTN